jgi:hypothetical protein
MADENDNKRRRIPQWLVDGVGIAGGVAGVGAALGVGGIVAGVVTGAALVGVGVLVWRRRNTGGADGPLTQKQDAFADALIRLKRIEPGHKVRSAKTTADVREARTAVISWRVDVEGEIRKALGPLAAEKFRRQTEVPAYDYKVEKPRILAKWNDKLMDFELKGLYEDEKQIELYKAAIDKILESISSLKDTDFR